MATFRLESLGGSWPNARPAVVAHPGRIDVFLVGEDGDLYHYWLKNGEHYRLESLGSAPSLGGNFQQGAVSAVSWNPDRRDVFAVSTDSRLVHYWQDAGEGFFHQETIRDVPGAGRPTAVSWGAPRWDVFLIADDQNLHHFAFPIDGPIGPRIDYEIWGRQWDVAVGVAAVAMYAGRIDVFVAGLFGDLYQCRMGWQQFDPARVDHGGHRPRFMDAVSYAPGRLDLFTTSNDSGIVWLDHYWQNPGFQFGREEVKTFHGSDLPVAATTWGPPRLDAFVVDADEHRDARHYWQENSPFQQESLENDWRRNLAAVSWGPRRLDLFTIGMNKQLFHYWQ